jgi:hypothetical protein
VTDDASGVTELFVLSAQVMSDYAKVSGLMDDDCESEARQTRAGAIDVHDRLLPHPPRGITIRDSASLGLLSRWTPPGST